jgi:hypothetical protein
MGKHIFFSLSIGTTLAALVEEQLFGFDVPSSVWKKKIRREI